MIRKNTEKRMCCRTGNNILQPGRISYHMPGIFFISGPCGCGKTTFADAYAKHLACQGQKTVYVIHGDDFHEGFVETEDKPDFFTEDGQPDYDEKGWWLLIKDLSL